MTVQCDLCGVTLAHGGALYSHRRSRPCQVTCARRRQHAAGRTDPIALQCAAVLARVGVDHAIDYVREHPGSRGRRGILTRACWTTPWASEILTLCDTDRRLLPLAVRERYLRAVLADRAVLAEITSVIAGPEGPALARCGWMPGTALERVDAAVAALLAGAVETAREILAA